MNSNESPVKSIQLKKNDMCFCGSGKKYKRCCGKSEKAPQPEGVEEAPPLPFSADQIDPALFAQMTQALNRLPRGQMQRLQALLQKAMRGKNIATEAEALQRGFPEEFQKIFSSLQTQAVANEAEKTSAEPEKNPAEQPSSSLNTHWKRLWGVLTKKK